LTSPTGEAEGPSLLGGPLGRDCAQVERELDGANVLPGQAVHCVEESRLRGCPIPGISVDDGRVLSWKTTAPVASSIRMLALSTRAGMSKSNGSMNPKLQAPKVPRPAGKMSAVALMLSLHRSVRRCAYASDCWSRLRTNHTSSERDAQRPGSAWRPRASARRGRPAAATPIIPGSPTKASTWSSPSEAAR